MTTPAPPAMADEKAMFRALWALVIGFFMILLDTTIVSVANPAIMRGLGLGNDYAGVIWVTSSYLLAYAVPLLVTGRLGDRFGARGIYLIGLAVFTLASAWCGLSAILPGGGLVMLVVARAVQGLGASLMAPQTMAIITRTFPPQRRGAAMGLWGSTAGIAGLVGPILGGVLVDGLGWEWIFFVNVPVGIVAFVAAVRLVPKLETHPHKFDLPGVALFVSAMFLIVFGLQEGQSHDWGTIVGPISVPGLIIAGVVLLVVFVVWQAVQSGEPLLPLELLRDRNFALANTAVSALGFAVTCLSLPLVFYLQTVRGLTPTQGALLLAPQALIGALTAVSVGRLVDRVRNSRTLIVPGVVTFLVGLLGYVWLLESDTSPLWLFFIPAVLVGLGSSFVWGPLSTTANRSLPPKWAGAGSGVYNTTRQLGSVLGSASIAALMEARIAFHLPGAAAGSTSGAVLPDPVKLPFSLAMADSLLLPVAVLVVAGVAAAFFLPPSFRREGAGQPAA